MLRLPLVFITSIGNGTIVGCSSVIAKNACIGDILSQNSGGRSIDQKNMGVGH